MTDVKFVTARENALNLIGAVPNYSQIATDLRKRRILYNPNLPDRGQASLLGRITLGPEVLEGRPNEVLVGVAGTLVHELYHCRQNPFLKTVSFWLGITTRTHPMRRYERPAYQAHSAFLMALAQSQPLLAEAAFLEQQAVHASFHAVYGCEL